MYFWKAVGGSCILIWYVVLRESSFPWISTTEVASLKLTWPIESQWPHPWKIRQIEINCNFPLMPRPGQYNANVVSILSAQSWIVWVSIRRDDLQNLTLVTTVLPFSDKCLSTYPDDSRSLGTEKTKKREEKFENLRFSFKCHSVLQGCLYFIEWLYSVLAAQSFRASARLIMTSVQGWASKLTQTQLYKSSLLANV